MSLSLSYLVSEFDLEAWLSLVSNACQQLLDLSDSLAGVKTLSKIIRIQFFSFLYNHTYLGAGLGAVHDGVASVD